MKYQRKADSTVDAFIWTGGPDQTEDPEWIVKAIENGSVWFVEKDNYHFMVLLGSLGQVLVNPGDYVFLDLDGMHAAPKSYFEKHFAPVLDEQKIQEMIDEGDRKTYNDVLEFLRNMNGG